MATVNALKDGNSFHWSAETANGIVNHLLSYDANAYLVSAKILHKFLKTRKNPYSRKRMLAPIAILEAMQKSLDRGRPVNVAKF